MKKFGWLTSFAILFCCATQAQEAHAASDSTADSTVMSGATGNVLHNFSAAIKESNKVWLQWDVDSAKDGDYLIAERSIDGIHFETIGALRKSLHQDHYELTDLDPPNGNDFYRIKYMAQDGSSSFSKTVQMSLSGDVSFKFYPNPVDKLFIIRTEHLIEIQVVDANGTTRVSKQLQPGIQVVNISTLERGVYILRVADKESNRIVSSQLLKN